MPDKQSEIERTASRLFLELDADAGKISGELFGGGPGLGARTMKRQDFVALWRKNWETPPRPEWRADELDRFAPRDPKTGARPEAGLRAFNALLKDAFPLGRPADPPKPPPPGVAGPPGAPPADPWMDAPPPSGPAAGPPPPTAIGGPQAGPDTLSVTPPPTPPPGPEAPPPSPF